MENGYYFILYQFRTDALMNNEFVRLIKVINHISKRKGKRKQAAPHVAGIMLFVSM